MPTIENKFEELSNRNKLFNSGSIRDYGNSLYSLQINSISARIIIQMKSIEDNDVYFVRDFIISKDRGFYFSTYIYPDLKSGNYLEKYPLPEEEIKSYINQKEKEVKAEAAKKENPPLPSKEMLRWLDEYELNIKYNIFETETWVKYALNEVDDSKMRDRDVKLFFSLLYKIVYHNYECKEITLENGSVFYLAKDESVGVIFSKFNIEGADRYVLHNGCHLKTQKRHWEESIDLVKKEKIKFEHSIESLARHSFRAYPKWTLKNDELWFIIQKNSEVSNLSLTEDQLLFFKNFKFPYYINGQAGSGKSTMLYYLFANGLYYKFQDLIQGDLIFLTENEYLLEQTQKSIFDLLSNNPEFQGVNSNQLASLNTNFSSFKEFLLQLVPKSERIKFTDELYLNFSRFKELYETSYLNDSIKRKYTAEECWFTIRTYIYGYDIDKRIDSSEYTEIVHAKAQRIPKDKFVGIEEHVLPFYEKLINEQGFWDKLYVIRFLNANRNFIPKFDLVVCDEAQDFCRVELRFILKLSSYLDYDLKRCDQIPIIFAGDPNQTVNPTGFREREMTEMLFTELKALANFEYNNEDSVYNPKYNYRSKQPVVTLANFIQFFRKKNFGIRLVKPQTPKRPEDKNSKIPNLFFSDSDIVNDLELFEDLLEKIQYKIFIVPVDTLDKEEFKENNDILKQVEDAEIKTSVEAKGAEYSQVVLYGFGEHFLSLFGSLIGRDSDNDSNFKKSYFFNKLYVAITRAQKELIIIDSARARDEFWKVLVDNAEINGDYWDVLNNFKTDSIVYNPGSIKVLSSKKEDALSNAKQDKIQGVYDRNSSRLRVAANQFYKIGELKEYYLCLAIAFEFKNEWKKAAEHYIKAEGSSNLENAAKCFFKGKYFNELESYGGAKIKTIDQDIRLIISNLMTNNELDLNNLKKLNNNRDTVSTILSGIDWKEDFINKLISLPIDDFTNRNIRQLAEILNEIADHENFNLWMKIGDLFYKVNHYKRAIRAWDKITNFESEGYIMAKIEVSKDEEDYENEAIWLNKLKDFKNDKKSEIEKNIINIYDEFNNNESIKNPHFLLSVYTSLLIQNPERDIHVIGEKVENYFSEDREILLSIYTKLLEENRLPSKAKDYVIKRYLKTSKNLLQKEGLSEKDLYIKLLLKYNLIRKNKNLNLRKYNPEEIKRIKDVPSRILFDPPAHFKNIKITNFRQFKELSFKNLGMINLIVGDNNVGKTSMLEAFLFDPNYSNFFRNLAFAYKERLNLPRKLDSNNVEYYDIDKDFIEDFIFSEAKENLISYSLWNDIDSWSYSIKKLENTEIEKSLGQTFGYNEDNFIGFIENSVLNVVEHSKILEHLNPNDTMLSPLIPFGKGFNNDLALAYFENIDKIKSIRNDFLENMKVFVPNIERIIVDTDNGEIIVEESNQEYGHNLYELGEGANKLFRILVQITLQRNNKLLIDEIDAGIHHTRFIKFWKTILTFADKYNTQIFATTHNIECIKSFDLILNQEDFTKFQDYSRVITIKKIDDKNIKTYVRIYDEFDYELENNFELRGE